MTSLNFSCTIAVSKDNDCITLMFMFNGSQLLATWLELSLRIWAVNGSQATEVKVLNMSESAVDAVWTTNGHIVCLLGSKAVVLVNTAVNVLM